MTAEEFREQCRQAGIPDDKPLSQVLLTVFVASETALASVKAGARGLTEEGEADLIRRVVKSVDGAAKESAARHRIQLGYWTSLIAGAAVAGSLAIGGIAGYWYGWRSGSHEVASTEGNVAAAFLNGPEAASLWATLMNNNDPRKAMEFCKGASVWADRGGKACAMPMWLEAPVPENRKP